MIAELVLQVSNTAHPPASAQVGRQLTVEPRCPTGEFLCPPDGLACSREQICQDNVIGTISGYVEDARNEPRPAISLELYGMKAMGVKQARATDGRLIPCASGRLIPSKSAALKAFVLDIEPCEPTAFVPLLGLQIRRDLRLTGANPAKSPRQTFRATLGRMPVTRLRDRTSAPWSLRCRGMSSRLPASQETARRTGLQ